MNILIVGAGAIGSLVGGTLAIGGSHVTLVGRRALADVVSDRGLLIERAGVRRVVKEIRVATSINDAIQMAAPYDVAILTVKSYDTVSALGELADSLALHGQPTIPLLSLQNGVGNEEAIAAALGAVNTVAGSITAPVEVPEAGHIRVKKPSYLIAMAPWDSNQPSPQFERLVETFEAAGVDLHTFPRSRELKWTKLLMNMLGNATCAILGISPAEAFANASTAGLEVDALREALSVMGRLGIRPVNLKPYPLALLSPIMRHAPRPLLGYLLRYIIGQARGGKMPSLFLDLERNRERSEVEWLNGAIVDRGELVHVATPVNRVLTRTVLDLARHPSKREEWHGAHGKLRAAVDEERRAGPHQSGY